MEGAVGLWWYSQWCNWLSWDVVIFLKLEVCNLKDWWIWKAPVVAVVWRLYSVQSCHYSYDLQESTTPSHYGLIHHCHKMRSINLQHLKNHCFLKNVALNPCRHSWCITHSWDCGMSTCECTHKVLKHSDLIICTSTVTTCVEGIGGRLTEMTIFAKNTYAINSGGLTNGWGMSWSELVFVLVTW
jgi:hypothetical protein